LNYLVFTAFPNLFLDSTIAISVMKWSFSNLLLIILFIEFFLSLFQTLTSSIILIGSLVVVWTLQSSTHSLFYFIPIFLCILKVFIISLGYFSFSLEIKPVSYELNFDHNIFYPDERESNLIILSVWWVSWLLLIFCEFTYIDISNLPPKNIWIKHSSYHPVSFTAKGPNFTSAL